jgi:membrane protease YdiL (CAAX protease family)
VALLFFVAPAVVAGLFLLKVVKPAPLLFPLIWGGGLLSIGVLLFDRTFNRRQLWNWAGLRAQLRPMLLRFVVLGAGSVALLALFEPARLFALPREKPALWAAIMIGYPIASVYPQELAFRALFFHRYAPVFGTGVVMVAANAVAFSFGHVVLLNGWAVGFCLIGGLLFAHTYRRTASLCAASFEHALYGCWVFTVGWGYYFYAGGAAAAAVA